MQIVRFTDQDYEGRIQALISRSSLFDQDIESRTKEIIQLVREKGDEAVIELTARFDKARLTPQQLAVTKAELFNSCIQVPESVQSAIDEARKNIIRFARRGIPRNWFIKNTHGAYVGEKFDPLQRVGIYIPGGSASLISTALMTVTLAKEAGCPQIVVCTPCDSNGMVNPTLLYAISSCGATEIYRIGGAQAIAAMALGTQTIKPVLKIFGPGNAYVVAAKRLLYGYVGVDLLPGPSELLVLADDSANPKFIVADLLAQAEHGSGHERVWLLTPSGQLLKQVGAQIQKAIKHVPRSTLLEKVLESNTWLVQTRSLAEAIALANRVAPEHCEIMTRNPNKVANEIKTAGAIFLGPWSPTALGDYVAGPNHTLPTGGAGRYLSGLSIEQFFRKTSIINYSKRALQNALPSLTILAELEGLQNHALSAQMRFTKYPSQLRRPNKRKATRS